MGPEGCLEAGNLGTSVMKFEPPRRHGPFDPRYGVRRHRVERLDTSPTVATAVEGTPDEAQLAAIGRWEGEGGAR